MKRILVGMAAASALYSAASFATDFDDRVYGGLFVKYIGVDVSDRGVNTSRDGVQLMVGKQFSSRLGAEVYASYNELGRNADGVLFKEGSAGVDVLLHPKAECNTVVRPFLKAGVGVTAYNQDDADLNVSLGGGLTWKLANRLSLRTDVVGRYLASSDNKPTGAGDGPVEMILTAGLVMPFGGSSSSTLSDCPEFTGVAETDRVMGVGTPAEIKMTAEAAPATDTSMPVAAASGDADADGVADDADRCPNTPAGAKVDINGCPVPETVVIYFAFDSAALNAAAQGALDRVAASMVNKTFVVAIANGHADSTGTEEYNMGLSQRRADAVANYLISKGVDASAIRTRAYGESRPAADNSTEIGRAKNRRVEINLLRQ